MKLVTVSTVRDEGAAEVAKEALSDAGIAVDLKRVSGNPYFAQMSASEWEVRVPEERVADAERVLARVEHEAEEAAVRQAGAAQVEPESEEPAPEADEPHGLRAPGPVFAWRLVWVGVALALLAFFAKYFFWER